jgi:protein-tyrosine phosphatase
MPAWRAAAVRLEGIDNFRDIGGYPAGGRLTQRGLVFRSGDLSRATEADRAALACLGIGAIVDLRRPMERERAPSRLWYGCDARIVSSDMADGFQDWAVALKAVPRVDADWFERHNLENYATLAFSPRNIWLIGQSLRLLASTERPVLVHCAAGKDRTGLLCAVLQRIAGVHMDDIVAEYLKTNAALLTEVRLARLGTWLEMQTGHRLDTHTLTAALAVRPAYLVSCFAGIESAHGSFDSYVREVLEVPDAITERLQEKLLT